MRLQKRLLLFFSMLFLLTSCATFQTAKEQPFSTWSSKKKLSLAIDVYKAEYDKYVAAAARTDLTETEKNYLRDKKKVLRALDGTIDSLIVVVEAGGAISPGLEAKLLEHLGFFGVQPM